MRLDWCHLQKKMLLYESERLAVWEEGDQVMFSLLRSRKKNIRSMLFPLRHKLNGVVGKKNTLKHNECLQQ